MEIFREGLLTGLSVAKMISSWMSTLPPSEEKATIKKWAEEVIAEAEKITWHGVYDKGG